MSNYDSGPGRVPEDERIRRIGEAVMSPAFAGKKAAVCIDDEEGKGERYKRKLLERYPGVAAGEIVKGPVPGVVTFHVWQAANPKIEAKCELCGEPMPPGEEMFKFHGYSGPCPEKR